MSLGIVENDKVPDSPPPSLCQDQRNDKFPEVVTEVSVKIKINEILEKLKAADDLASQEHYEDFRYLWQMCRYSTNTSLRKIVVYTYLNENFLSIFEKFWKLKENCNIFDAQNQWLWKNFRSAISVLWNSSDASSAICQQFARTSLLGQFLESLKYFSVQPKFVEDDQKLYFVKAMLGILHNIVNNFEESKTMIRSFNGIEILQSFLIFDNNMVKAKALITLSYIIDEDKNETINAEKGVINYIVEMLKDSLSSPDHFSSKYGMSALEIAEGLNNIAVNDNNKIKIVQCKALPLLVKMMKLDRNSQYLGVMVLWTLAFSPVNCPSISKEPGCLEALNDIVKSEDTTLSHAARGALWEIDDYEQENAANESESGHVMISYQWDAQPVLLKIKDKLKQAGYKVWMDVEHMSGSTLEAMALAVEKSAVILVGISEKYKLSPSCRTEAEYIYRLRKDIIPIQVEKGYRPDGWLGMMVGTKLYFNFTDDGLVEHQIPRLYRELGDRGLITSKLKLNSAQTLSREDSIQTKSQCCNWSSDQVADWLESNGVPLYSSSLKEMDGNLLLELKNIKHRAPTYFYNILQQEFGLGILDVIKFSRIIELLP
ncbi:hypothetical protein LOTGIDRAFT_232580 [Lottia gigantea]|uniref:TIR domain-containing protein n=1 Tax=Lottia gigantea TaxID=225164 RepID=V3ZQ25_LOTGI|nr:hypothetical protein LOTGIDRAFT_232580 [Lottia gigantea]ESO93488.1 hypothetical protein LOTGIDRAFT_232580 [Lottia gigantea]